MPIYKLFRLVLFHFHNFLGKKDMSSIYPLFVSLIK